MPKKISSNTTPTKDVVATEVVPQTKPKRTTRKAATSKTAIESAPLTAKTVVKPVPNPKPIRKKTTKSTVVSIPNSNDPIKKEVIAEKVIAPTVPEKKPAARKQLRSKKVTTQVEQQIQEVQKVTTTPLETKDTADETSETENESGNKKPYSKNQRFKRNQQRQQSGPPPVLEIRLKKDIPIVETPVEVSPISPELTVQVSNEIVKKNIQKIEILTSEEQDSNIAPIPAKKKNKRKKKPQRNENTPIESTVEVEIPKVEEVVVAKPVQKPQQKKQQQQAPKEVKKVKPSLPINEKSKKLFSYLTPIAKEFVRKVFHSLEAIVSKVENETFIVCVSGGKDSIVLLDALWYISGIVPIKIIIVHCNHNLRDEESNEDERFVKFLGKKYDLVTHCSSLNVISFSKKYKQSIELSARTLRYRFFERVAKEQSVPFILTAHTKDDSVETMLFNLLRGTGLRGITGIPRKRELDVNINVVRPILSISREEITTYANERQLEWREDSSNSNLTYTRNKIRHTLLPFLKEQFNPSILDTLFRFTEFAKGAETIVSENVLKYLPHVVSNKTNSSLSISVESFKALSRFIKGEVLIRLISGHFETTITLLHIEGIIQLTDKETGSVFSINDQLRVVKERSELVVTNSHTLKQQPIFIEKRGTFSFGSWTLTLEKISKQSIVYTEDPNIEYIDEDTLPSLLILRHWQHGDRFSPLGMEGLEQNVSDYLTNSKIPHLERENSFVLSSTARIFWVCGFRLSEDCKVTSETTNVLKATVYLRSEKK